MRTQAHVAFGVGGLQAQQLARAGVGGIQRPAGGQHSERGGPARQRGARTFSRRRGVRCWQRRQGHQPRRRGRTACAKQGQQEDRQDTGRIALDSETTLAGVPFEAWTYKLGNRSALEWILDQYKEKKPKDPTIREKFNTYRFADYKDKVIDLLSRVTRVSVETQDIVDAMGKARR